MDHTLCGHCKSFAGIGYRVKLNCLLVVQNWFALLACNSWMARGLFSIPGYSTDCFSYKLWSLFKWLTCAMWEAPWPHTAPCSTSAGVPAGLLAVSPAASGFWDHFLSVMLDIIHLTSPFDVRFLLDTCLCLFCTGLFFFLFFLILIAVVTFKHIR